MQAFSSLPEVTMFICASKGADAASAHMMWRALSHLVELKPRGPLLLGTKQLLDLGRGDHVYANHVPAALADNLLEHVAADEAGDADDADGELFLLRHFCRVAARRARAACDGAHGTRRLRAL